MKKILVIGSGLSGLVCAIELASRGIHTILASPYPSERAQSVMAQGGINSPRGEGDSPELHCEDTVRSGGDIADRDAVYSMCREALEITDWLERLGTVFNRDKKGNVSLRAFGGQSKDRTAYAGSSTGKQIMSALVREARRYECEGLITRLMGYQFHSALIKEEVCYGAILYNEIKGEMEAVYADALVMATGGQNGVFGKTTGSTLCDGYAAARLFLQGAALKNLEFIQYHPTTVETPQKRMLISEAARGEGGRLYYEKDKKRVYFMEEAFGEKGNLMPRDVVAKCIYDAPSKVFLDISFLGEKLISERLFEVKEVAEKYAGIDVTCESIPVYPSVHFFMGGLWVDKCHRTTVDRVYAIGECASMYHGANRLGGNSLLSAIYSARVAARSVSELSEQKEAANFTKALESAKAELTERRQSQSQFSAMYIRYEMAKLMNDCLGICRNEEKLKEGIEGIDYYLSVCEKLSFDSDVSPYVSYSLMPMLALSKAILTCALERRESRGAHIREDYPERLEKYRRCSVICYNGGEYKVSFEEEGRV